MTTEITPDKRRRLLKIAKILGTLVIVGLAFLPVLHNSWQLRLVCLLLLIPAVPPIACLSLLYPTRIKVPASWDKTLDRFSLVPKDPKLIKRVCLIGMLATALLFYAVIVLPLEVSGIRTLHKGSASRITAKATNSDITGAWFLYQDVTLEGDSDSYFYFLASSPVRVGRQYDFWVLPGYHIILQHKVAISEVSSGGSP